MNGKVFNCKSLIIGHRGAKGEMMENTLESILHAINTGVDGIEFDVQTCSTGELVLFHDLTVDNLVFKDQFYFGKTKGVKIRDLQWYHLYNTELIDTLGRKYRIPKLVDVLYHPSVYNSDLLIQIDIKDEISHEAISDLIYDLIEEGMYEPERFLVSSENLESLLYLSEFKEDLKNKDENYDNFKIGWVVSQENLPVNGLSNFLKIQSKVLTHIVICKDITNLDMINNIKQKIFVYTVNDQSEMPIPNLHNIVEGIITDKPSYFRVN